MNGQGISLNGEGWIAFDRILPLDTTTPYSIAIKFCIHEFTTYNSYIFGQNESLTENRFGVYVDSSGQLYCFKFPSLGAQSLDFKIEINKTYMLFVRRQNNSVIDFIVDGTIVKSLSDIKPNANVDFKLGSWGNNSGWMKGNIYQFSVWNKSLTMTEILNYINNGVNLNDSSLKGHWDMNEGIGDIVYNSITGSHGNGIVEKGKWIIDSKSLYLIKSPSKILTMNDLGELINTDMTEPLTKLEFETKGFTNLQSLLESKSKKIVSTNYQNNLDEGRVYSVSISRAEIPVVENVLICDDKSDKRGEN